MFDSFKSGLNIFSGIFLIAFGIIGVLIHFKVLSFTIPDIPLMVFHVFLAVAGLYLMIDGLMLITMHPTLMVIDLLLGLLAAVLGLIPLLYKLGTIGFEIPFIGSVVYYFIFVIVGGLYIFNSWNF